MASTRGSVKVNYIGLVRVQDSPCQRSESLQKHYKSPALRSSTVEITLNDARVLYELRFMKGFTIQSPIGTVVCCR